MWSNLPLFPPTASTNAHQVDALYFVLVGLTVFFTVLIALLIAIFALRYRRQRHPVAIQIEGSNALELTWTLIPTGIAMVIFVWAAAIYFSQSRPPRDALEIYVVGKQWMWKIQHTGGQREINTLHVPLGRPVRLIMTSQDVIHDFFVPAFRIKADVIPGRYTSTWFTADKPGTYHLFCAQYCGTQHSGMIGEVVVMEPAAYQQWAQQGAESSLAASGEKTFQQYGCSMCHRSDYQGRGPNLVGLFGKPVLLDDGRTVVADESYIRESILFPGAKIASGFKNIMPNFQGQISEDEVIALVAYIKGLGTGQTNPPASMTEPTGVYPVVPQPERSQATPSGK